MIITYKNTDIKIGFAEEDLSNNKVALLTELAKSNARLAKAKAEYDKEKAVNDRLVAMRKELYKREKSEELKYDNDGKLLCKKAQIELCFSQGKSYEEIALLTEATPAYIYKVISNYKKKNKIKIDKPAQSELEETIKLGYYSRKSIEEIAALAKVSRQYVYKVLKKNNMPYPARKKK
jgi:DNA-binding CsgD family transcriptional regulator